jgi:hypothetical protein
LQANPAYVFVDGDVYQIPQTYTAEGAAVGASFGGLGVDNQPHQVLLNKINYLHAQQTDNESAITSLQALTGLVTSFVGTNGWLSLGTVDESLGHIDVLIQWGSIPGSLLTTLLQSNYFANPAVPFAFPRTFSSAVWVITPYWQADSGDLVWGATVNTNIDIYQPVLTPIQPYGLSNNTIAMNLDAYQVKAISGNPLHGITGIGWWAVGY